MDSILEIARYICQQYKKISGETLDEMKLHKLLYFAQRESFAVLGKPLFIENMEAWIYGPVSPEVRANYETLKKDKTPSRISRMGKKIVNRVLKKYAAIASWKLSQLSHEEISWRNARGKLNGSERGDTPLNLEDIKIDAAKENCTIETISDEDRDAILEKIENKYYDAFVGLAK